MGVHLCNNSALCDENVKNQICTILGINIRKYQNWNLMKREQATKAQNIFKDKSCNIDWVC